MTICHSGTSGITSLSISAPPYSAPAVSTTMLRKMVSAEKYTRARRSKRRSRNSGSVYTCERSRKGRKNTQKKASTTVAIHS